jgi:hypothetical protein
VQRNGVGRLYYLRGQARLCRPPLATARQAGYGAEDELGAVSWGGIIPHKEGFVRQGLDMPMGEREEHAVAVPPGCR